VGLALERPGLLAQARFIQRRSAFTSLVHVALFNHAKRRFRERQPPVCVVPSSDKTALHGKGFHQ